MRHFTQITFFLLALFSCFSLDAQRVTRFDTSVEVFGGAGLQGRTRWIAGVNLAGVFHLNDFLAIGAGAGYQYSNALTLQTTSIGGTHGGIRNSYSDLGRLQVFGRATMLLARSGVLPFVQLDAGYSFAPTISGARDAGNIGWKSMTGLLLEPSAGIVFPLFRGHDAFVSLGYQRQHTNYYSELYVDDILSELSCPVDKQARALVLRWGYFF